MVGAHIQRDSREVSMRDPKRIEPLLDQIKDTWEFVPDLRLGQLLCIMAGEDDVFNLEDDVLSERLKNHV